MKVLIVGGCGFIGAHIVKSLCKDGFSIVVFDANCTPELSGDLCTFVRGSLSDLDLLESVFAKNDFDYVVHLVSTTLPKSSNENMPFDVTSNVVQTLFLLDLCVKFKVKKILFMSSGGTIYGTPLHVPVPETHACNPICSYGVSKLAIEKYLFLYKHLFGLDYVALRAANPYGPGQNPFSNQGVILNFAHKMLSHQPIEVWGDGNTIRDYFYVHDLVELSKLALASKYVGVFNAGSGVGLSINQLILSLEKVIGYKAEVVYKHSRNFDVPNIVLDCSAAKDKFYWEATTSLQVGLENTVNWYRSRFL